MGDLSSAKTNRTGDVGRRALGFALGTMAAARLSGRGRSQTSSFLPQTTKREF